MKNPNNCQTCEYSLIQTGAKGHCYMFRKAPAVICAKHTALDIPSDREVLAMFSKPLSEWECIKGITTK